MRNFKIISAILGLLLAFVTMADDNSIDHGAGGPDLTGSTYTATIISPKAVVYADENLLSPLGYVVNGKSITVGNPRRINPNIVPLVVYGRLGFIEIKDIRYEDKIDENTSSKRTAPREHDFDVILQKPEERLSINNSFYFAFHRYTAGNDTKSAFYNTERSDVDNFTGYDFQFIHRQSTSRFFWGAGLDYSVASTQNMEFLYWLISPTFGYTPIKNPLFLIDVYASFDLALSTEFRVKAIDTDTSSAYVWGGQINARAVFFPESRYHVYAGIGFRRYAVTGLNPLEDLVENEIPGIKSINGVSLFLGAAIEFK